MSGPGVGTADPEHRSHDRRRGVWVGLVIGVIVVSGALLAVFQSGGDDEAPPQQADGPREFTHEFPADYGGQVWITVTSPDDSPRQVTIRWGPWEKRFVHESDEPLTYWFTKDPPKPGAENVPVTVTVDPGADVTFDQGTAPLEAIDKSTEWDEAPEAPSDVAPS
jgi:hypothetical protein